MGKETNWNAAWQKTWQAVEVGERWYLAPPWSRKPAPAGRIRLSLHAGNYFGNGDHATTQMLLALMEGTVRRGVSFLDVGCGSGLLCMAAAKLGAEVLEGCDVDVGAVRAARRRFRGARYAVGSTELYRDGEWDVCAANLALGVLEQIEPELRRVVRRGGVLLVSGVLEEQGAGARRLLQPWDVREERSKGGWLAFRAARR